jgi:hypothetical protein
MDSHDEEFEQYLGEFDPRRPRALPAAVGSRRVWPQRLAAAAAITIAMGTSLWMFHGKSSNERNSSAANSNAAADSTTTGRRMSLAALTQMALHDPAQLDAELAEASRRMLPDFRRSDSTLRVLAKE